MDNEENINMEESKNNIGKNVAELRKRKGWTQDDLAEKTLISKRQIQYIESGKKNPSPYNLRMLEECFGVPTGTLTSSSIHEATVFYKEARNDAAVAATEWLLRNLSNDSPNTRALSLAISEYIDKDHSLMRGIMEHLGYTTVYVPTFRYTAEEYSECIKVMKEYDEKADFSSFYTCWDIYVDEDIDFDDFLKKKEESYINEHLNYPLLIHRIEELGDQFIYNPPLVRTFPLDIRISRNDKAIGQTTLQKFIILTYHMKEAVDNVVTSSENLFVKLDETASLIPNLEKDLALNKKLNERKKKLNIEKK